ncbi:spondin domain-containing protein [Photobacterium sp. ZSDE20]|uniref:Spondin domain-containing protein n=1 Tax=Photobacterium pectinilyticum TaxID=2906793 RepID=A0ABT1N1R4_9GAMM|nr:spondin domain-containing protein [Photobacterium sp. ZSDE20]MCQ1058624.1 spondin domain-containing protein [Photobacterium sp. ZSDE20]MDD1824056.1 spondin domain-containing protein [Photobacterium sp. ZSDE20]
MKNYRLLLLAASVALLAGCPTDSDDDDPVPPEETLATFSVEVKNTSANQPLSPLAVIGHSNDYQLFTIGQPASEALEMLAESGDNSTLLSEQADGISVQAAGSGVILPAGSDSVTVTIDTSTSSYLSVASMLVNTNDAFVAETAMDLADLAVGDTLRIAMPAWDSGTEANDEAAETIPGPAAGGEGFNSERDDNDRVSFHPGVISKDDGLSTSILDATHRFQSPAAQLIITRTE